MVVALAPDSGEANQLVRFQPLDVALARLAAVGVLVAIVSDTIRTQASRILRREILIRWVWLELWRRRWRLEVSPL